MAGNVLPLCVNFQTWTSAPIATTSPQRDKRRNGLFQVKVIQWAADLAKGFGAYVGVDLSGLARAVPQQCLDVAKVGSLLQEVGGKAMAQGMHGGRFCNARLFLGPVEDGLYAARGVGCSVRAFKQVPYWFVLREIGLNGVHGLGAQQGDAVLVAFASTDQQLLAVGCQVR